jgi:hypothetical protein
MESAGSLSMRSLRAGAEIGQSRSSFMREERLRRLLWMSYSTVRRHMSSKSITDGSVARML